MADMPIDPGFAPSRFANVESELDLAADRKLVTGGEVADFPVDPLPVLPVVQLRFSIDGRIADCAGYLNLMLSHFHMYIELGDGFLW